MGLAPDHYRGWGSSGSRLAGHQHDGDPFVSRDPVRRIPTPPGDDDDARALPTSPSRVRGLRGDRRATPCVAPPPSKRPSHPSLEASPRPGKSMRCAVSASNTFEIGIGTGTPSTSPCPLRARRLFRRTCASQADIGASMGITGPEEAGEAASSCFLWFSEWLAPLAFACPTALAFAWSAAALDS